MPDKIIYELLKDICSMQNDTGCLIRCVYSDGISSSVFSIRFYNKETEGTFGTIAFNGEDGKVCHGFYRGKRISKMEDIIDLLLDIYNEETSRMAS